MTVRPIEEFLLLEPRTGGLPLDAQRLAVSAQGRIEEARAFMVATVAKEFAQKHRDRLNADLASRIEFLRQGFFYEQKELVEVPHGVEQTAARESSIGGTRDCAHP